MTKGNIAGIVCIKVENMGSDNMSLQKLTGKAQIRIRSEPINVFNAFVNAESMSKFWFYRRDEGLQKGKTSIWYMGEEPGSFSFEIFVKDLHPPEKIVIVWEREGEDVEVAWRIEETPEGQSILSIEESGFSGTTESIINQALDSTGGFNQVIVAAKVFIEYGNEFNVVSEHA